MVGRHEAPHLGVDPLAGGPVGQVGVAPRQPLGVGVDLEPDSCAIRARRSSRSGSSVKIRREDLQPGDLVFFNTLKRTFSHVGIYVGGNRFVHAPRPGGEVRTEDMGYAYWKSRFTGARRAEAVAGLAPLAAPADATAIALH